MKSRLFVFLAIWMSLFSCAWAVVPQVELRIEEQTLSALQNDLLSPPIWLIIVALVSFIVLIVLMQRLSKRIDIENRHIKKQFKHWFIIVLILFVSFIASLTSWVLEYNKLQILKDKQFDLELILNTTHERLSIWIQNHKTELLKLAHNKELVSITERLLKVPPKSEILRISPELAEARHFFLSRKDTFGDKGFFIIDTNEVNFGSTRDTNLGIHNLIALKRPDLFARVLEGEVLFVPPIESDVALNSNSDICANSVTTTMFFAAPIFNDKGKAIAVLTQRLDPLEDFSKLLNFGLIGKTGETYAFSRQGRLLSESRFNEQLRTVGLIGTGQHSGLLTEIRDPGGNLLSEYKPKIKRSEQPLTKMAAKAVSGESGRDMSGYRDYRGVPVYGAWLWDNTLDIGLATEINVEEVLSTYYITRKSIFGVLFVMFFLSAGAILFTLFTVDRANIKLRRLNEDLKFEIRERINTEAKVREREALFRSLFDNSLYAIIIGGSDLKIQRVNSAACKLLEYDESELIGKLRISDITYHDNIDASRAMVEKLINKEIGSFEIEKRYIAKSGRIIDAVTFVQAVYDENGCFINAAGTIMDITDRKQAENKLHEHMENLERLILERTKSLSEANKELRLFKNLMNQTTDAIFINDALTGRILDLNDTALKKLGYSRSEVLQRRVVDFDTNISDTFSWEKHRKELHEKGSILLQSSHRRKDGTVFPVEVHVAEVELDGTYYNLAIVRDITERMRVDAELSEANSMLANIFETTHVLFAYMDRDFNFIKVNRAYADADGHFPDYFVGKNHFDLYPDEENKTIFRQVVDSGMPYSVKAKPFTYINDLERGVTYWDWTLLPIKNVNGNVKSLVFTLIEVTENKQLQADLIDAKEAAETANQAKSRFLANMSHEIRTPMNAILGFFELLDKTELNNQQKEYVKKINNATNTLLYLINDILDFAKIEAGKINIVPVVFSPRKLFLESIGLFELEARNKNILLDYEIDEGLPEYLMGDPEHIRGVLINLISNAIKFTERGSVHIALFILNYCHGLCQIEFSVSDTGIGIPAEKQADLFDAFVQVDDLRRGEKRGTGLGLAISKQLAEAMGGSIEVESEYGSGSTFSFELTLEEVNNIVPAATLQKRKLSFENLKILIADDNEDNRQIVTTMLTSAGANVDKAINGRIAVEMVRKNHYDLVLMDIQMPEMDGLSATRMLRDEGFSDLIIIAISAHTSKEEQKRSFDAGMNDHINKPFKTKDLYKLLVYWFPDRVIQVQDSKAGVDCWIHELPVVPGLVLSDEICNYWLKKDDFFEGLKAFILNIAQESERLLEMVDEKNISAAQNHLHNLKGSAKLYGANRLFKSIVQFEDAVKESENGISTDIIDEFNAAVLEITT